MKRNIISIIVKLRKESLFRNTAMKKGLLESIIEKDYWGVFSAASGFGIYHLGKKFALKRRHKVGIKHPLNASQTIDFSASAI